MLLVVIFTVAAILTLLLSASAAQDLVVEPPRGKADLFIEASLLVCVLVSAVGALLYAWS